MTTETTAPSRRSLVAYGVVIGVVFSLIVPTTVSLLREKWAFDAKLHVPVCVGWPSEEDVRIAMYGKTPGYTIRATECGLFQSPPRDMQCRGLRHLQCGYVNDDGTVNWNDGVYID